MTDEVASLRLRIDSLEAKQAIYELEKLIAAGKRAERGALTMGSAFRVLSGVLGGLALTSIARAVLGVADSMKSMESRLRLVTNSSKELAETQKELFAVSQRSRVEYASTIDLYTRLARSTKTLGTSQADLLKVTEAINQSFVISGTSAASTQAALIQLGQAFASGTLRGEELNSVMEQAPRLAEAIASGLGVTIGELRRLGAEGKLTSEQVFNALKKSAEGINAEFKRMPVTTGQAFTQLGNSIAKAIGDIDKMTDASQSVANAVSGIARAIEDVGKSAEENKGVILSVLGALGGAATAAGILRVASAITGAGGIVAAIYKVRAAMLALLAVISANPVGLALVLGSAVVGAVVMNNDKANQEAKTLAWRSERLQAEIARTQKNIDALRAKGSPYAKLVADNEAYLKRLNAQLQVVQNRQDIAAGKLDTRAEDARLLRYAEEAKKALEGKKSGGIDVAAVKRDLTSLLALYEASETILEARHSAGLVSERQFYEAKVSFINLERDARLKALSEEQKTLTQSVEDKKRAADITAEIAKINVTANAKIETAAIEVAAANQRQVESFEAAKNAAQEYLDAIARANAEEIAAIGKGQRQKEIDERKSRRSDYYVGRVESITDDFNKSDRGAEAAARRDAFLAGAKETYDKALAEDEGFWKEREQNESSWLIGVKASWSDWSTMVSNNVEQARSVTTKAFEGMSDALTDFVLTGKADFKGLADSIIRDLVRIQIQQAIVGLWRGIGNTGSSGGTTTAPAKHSGGIAGSGATFYKTVDSSAFDMAPRLHTGGVAGLANDEVPTILRRGEGVFTPAQMRALAPASGNAPSVIQQVTYNVPSGMSPAAYAAALEQNNRRLKAELISDFQRNGDVRRALNTG